MVKFIIFCKIQKNITLSYFLDSLHDGASTVPLFDAAAQDALYNSSVNGAEAGTLLVMQTVRCE